MLMVKCDNCKKVKENNGKFVIINFEVFCEDCC